MAANLKVGDIVYLNSSKDVIMTVEEVDGTDISCVWLNNKKETARGCYPAATLTRAPSQNDGPLYIEPDHS
jgi:hypothetical protein